jgi:hypothetical protein
MLEQEPERTATGVTRVREWRDGVPAQAESQKRTDLTEAGGSGAGSCQERQFGVQEICQKRDVQANVLIGSKSTEKMQQAADLEADIQRD